MKDWISPIPKKIHLIWIGKLDPPDYFTKYFLPSFHKHLPEFEIKVWGNKDITKKNFPKTFEYIKEAKKRQGKPIKDEDGYIMYSDHTLKKPLTYSKWAQITDLMRIEIVYNHGGFFQKKVRYWKANCPKEKQQTRNHIDSYLEEYFISEVTP